MEAQYKYYDEAQKIKIVEVAIPELDGKAYTYLMTDDYLALAQELLQFGFNEKFVESDFIPNPHLSPAVQKAMAAASFDSFSYKGGKGKGEYVPNRAVICRRTLPKPSQLHRDRQKHPEFIHTFENLRCLEHSSRNPVHLIYRHRTRRGQEANHSTGEKISLEDKK